VDEVALKEVSVEVSSVFTLLNTILPLLHTHATARLCCAIALTRQHIIMSLVFMCGASSLIQVWAGYELRKSVLIHP
jgi:hypothetical protein